MGAREPPPPVGRRRSLGRRPHVPPGRAAVPDRRARGRPGGVPVPRPPGLLRADASCAVTAFNWDAATGALQEFQTVPTLPADFKGTSTCAEIMVHPNGRFLYGSNRGHDSLAVFTIDPDTGRLAPLEHVSTQGKSPRNFAFDPTGKWIICTNHGSDNAVVFRVDEATGRLTPAGLPVSVPSPFCERFLPVP